MEFLPNFSSLRLPSGLQPANFGPRPDSTRLGGATESVPASRPTETLQRWSMTKPGTIRVVIRTHCFYFETLSVGQRPDRIPPHRPRAGLFSPAAKHDEGSSKLCRPSTHLCHLLLISGGCQFLHRSSPHDLAALTQSSVPSPRFAAVVWGRAYSSQRPTPSSSRGIGTCGMSLTTYRSRQARPEMTGRCWAVGCGLSGL